MCRRRAFLLFGGVSLVPNPTEQLSCFGASRLGCPGRAVSANCISLHPSRSAAHTVLDEVDLSAGGRHLQPEALQLSVPNKDILARRLCPIDLALGQLRSHFRPW